MTETARIVLTRQENLNRPWAERLAAAGHRVLELPVVRFLPLVEPGEAKTDSYDWILFTSPHAVSTYFAITLGSGQARFACLGPGTSAALTEAGEKDALGLKTRDGSEFVAAFAARVEAPARILLPGSAKRMGEPPVFLKQAGFEVTELALYDTVAVPSSELPPAVLAGGDIVFFCSPSTVHAFTGAYDERPECVAIGETTARVAREAGFPTAVAATPDLQAMLQAAGLGADPITSSPENES